MKCYSSSVTCNTRGNQLNQELSLPERRRLYKKRISLLTKLSKRFGKICWYCRTPFNDFKEVEIDHILAKCHGGTDRISNLAIACIKCNRAKGYFYLNEFLEWLIKPKKPVTYIIDKGKRA